MKFELKSTLLALIAASALLIAAGCDDSGGKKTDPDSSETTDVTTTDTGLPDLVPDTADPCDNLANPCAAAGATCSGNSIVTCEANADGCLVSSTQNCATDEVCVDDGAGTVACEVEDLCLTVTNPCAAADRACDGTNLVVCAADANGCLVETTTDCTTGGMNICDATANPVACAYDACAGISDCTTPGASCNGDSLVVCAADAFGCLVETTTDCTTATAGTCDTATALCTTTDVCPTACTAGSDCMGNSLVECAPDAFGCLVETTTNCAAVTDGFCDASGMTAMCDIDVGDRCAGKALCTTMGTTCETGSENLLDCQYDSVGCLVLTTTNCATANNNICNDDGAGNVACQPPCTPDAACATATEGDATCTLNNLAVCTDTDGNGCLELMAVACGTDLCDATNGVCAANGSGDSCAAADVLVVPQSGFYFVGDISTFTDAQTLAGTACDNPTTAAADMVFEVALQTGETVYADEYGPWAAWIHILKACDNTTACEISEMEPSAAAVSYTAVADETVYVIFESDGAPGTSVDFQIAIDIDPACGNSIVEQTTAEGCDDGNTVDGDGCDATCAPELGYDCSVASPSVCKPWTHLGDFAGGDTIPDTTGGLIASGDSVGYSITFTEDVRVSGTLSSTSTGDIDFYVVDADGNVVFDSTADGDETWADETLPAGTYYLVIHAWAGGDDVDGWLLTLSTSAIVCGDAVVDATEGCDDGNAVDADGCTACVVDAGYNCTGSPSVCGLAVPGDSCGAPTVVDPSTGLTLTGTDFNADFSDQQYFDGTGCLSTSTSGTPEEAVFSVALTTGQIVNLSQHTTSDFVLSILKSCGPTVACEDSVDYGEDVGATYVATTNETVFLVVETWSGSVSVRPYDIRITIRTPGCGDGFLDAGETCDDGNTVDADGCTACAIDLGYNCGGEPSVCTMAPVGGDSCTDPIVVNPNAGLHLTGPDFNSDFSDQQAFTGTGCATTESTGTPVEAVFVVDLGAGQIVTLSEDTASDFILSVLPVCDGAAACSASTDFDEAIGVSFTATTNGPVFLVVETWSGSASVRPYDISITVRTPSCGDGVAEGIEACDDGNSVDNDGCTACVIDAGYNCTGTPSVCAVMPVGDSCSDPVVVTSSGSFTGNFADFADNYNPGSGGCAGGYAQPGPDAAYQVTLSAGQTVTASLDSSTFTDVGVYIVSDCGNVVNSCLDGSDSGEPEVATYTATAPITVFVIADKWDSPLAGAFTLDITITP